MSHFSSSSRHHVGRDGDQTLKAGSSSTPLPRQNYEVFLSFRGEDTRRGFTDHLYHRLDDKGIIVFRDNEELRVGEKIDQLFEAIKASKISVPIISSDYASSIWCLKELLQILECSKTSGQLVLPIFYKVKPSDVRKQKGVFGKKFRLCRKENDLDGEFVQDLKNAFNEVASMKGWESDKTADGHEGKLVKLVVARIFNELRKAILFVPDFLVGVEDHIEEIRKRLDTGPPNNAKVIVIHGMGGIGKTTLAKVLYNELSKYFECCSFVPNIREASSKYKGMEGLQKQVISDILVDKSLQEISHVDEGITIIEKRFKGKRLLLLLDDIENKDQLDKLVVKNNCFGPESIVIVTTRNKNVVASTMMNLSYELNELDYDQSYRLFCKHAFGWDASCPRDLEIVARDIVLMTGGLPLAIEIIGSFLCGKSENIWKDTKEKLRRMPNSTVRDKLKISYDALDDVQQQIFLDIACLFNIRFELKFAFYMWKSCDFYPEEGIEVLVSLSLIKIQDENNVVMHDQLKDLGREIVHKEGRNKIGECTRIWLQDEAIEVLEGKQGTRNVEALMLGSPYNCRERICCNSEQFEGMTKLRYFFLGNVHLIGDFEHLFLNLRWLRWERHWLYLNDEEFDIMGINSNLKKLVILDLWKNNITENWKGWSQMKDLKVLRLGLCRKLAMIPDLSVLKRLEVLILQGCDSLIKIHSSIGQFSKTLKELSLRGCRALESLPLEVGKMDELRQLNLSETAISEIPIFEGHMQKLEVLSASYCYHLRSIPDSIGSRVKLQCLDVSYCTSLMKIPETIGKLKLLSKLDVSFTRVTHLPDSIGDLCNLKELLISHTPIKCFPTSIGMLSQLQELNLEGCQELESLSSLPCNLTSLKFHGDSMETLPNISNLTNLNHLTYRDLFERKNRALNLGKLNQLESLKICHSKYDLKKDLVFSFSVKEDSGSQEEIKISNSVEEINRAPENFSLLLELPLSLVELAVFGCQTLRTLPSLSNLKNLSSLYLKDCSELIEKLTSLTDLSFSRCNTKMKFPDFSMLTKLKVLRIEDEELIEIPWLYELKSLTELIISCKSLQYLPDLSHLTKLWLLEVCDCEKLTEIQGIENMTSLRELRIKGCTPLRKLPDLPNVKIFPYTS